MLTFDCIKKLTQGYYIAKLLPIEDATIYTPFPKNVNDGFPNSGQQGIITSLVL